jgi:ketosteroid isomerase-like protein
MTKSRAIAGLSALLLAACNKSTPGTADSATPAGGSAVAFDKDAARQEILRADSAFVRGMLAKQVDSVMPYYDENVVSMSEGGKAVKGTRDLRNAYTEAVKSGPRDVSWQSGGVNFSDDGSMAWDYGTVTSTADGPNGRPVKSSGNFLNVWKRVGSRWLLVAEISNSSQPAR